MRPYSSPLRAEAALTSRCNLRCRYCHFFGSAGEKKRELDTAEWLGIFDELGAMKVMELTLTGGEVLLREDLPELIAGIRRNNMRFLLLSNGFAFEEHHAAMLKESGRCVYVQISIDGPEAANDLARGSGTYARAVRAMKLVLRYGIPLTVRMTVGRHNFRLLPETARLMIEENNVRALTCNPAFHFTGKEDESDLPWIMSRREFLTALSDALATARNHPERFSLRGTMFGRAAAQWSHLRRCRRENRPPAAPSPCASNCLAQLEKLYIGADGSVTPCNHLPDAVIGQAGRDRLADLWENAPILRQMRAPGKALRQEFPLCRGCGYAPWCVPTARCLNSGGRASFVCLKLHEEEAPDFDFEEMKWKQNAVLK